SPRGGKDLTAPRRSVREAKLSCDGSRRALRTCNGSGMRICLCRQGATLLELLRAELPEDEGLECSPEEVLDLAPTLNLLVPLVTPVGEALLASRRVRLVQQFGAGLDGVDIDSASRHGVYVANVPSGETANADSVAELAVFLMIALARRWTRAQESLRT